MYKRFLLLLVFIVLQYATAFAVVESTQIANDTISPAQEVRYDKDPVKGTALDKTQIERYKNDPNFDYREYETEETWLDRVWNKIGEWWASFMKWLAGGGEATGIWGFLLRILPYLLILGLVALLIWVFLKIDGPNAIIAPARKHAAILGDDEDIIKNQDIQSLIDSALQEKNYRLAIRYYYLLTLQKLSDKEYINWQVQKTNHDYIYEIKDSALRTNFSKVTDVYDYIWYGNFAVDEYAFAKAQSTFNIINQQL